MEETKTTERWVPAKYFRTDGEILDFTGLYEVSDHGRVRSLNYIHTGKTRMLSLGTIRNKSKYIFYNVMLCFGKKSYTLSVHRLVLSSFKESEYKPGLVVDHIVPRTKSCCNNYLSNLRWVSVQQNVSTKHCRTLLSKANTNHPSYSKKVRVTDLTTGEITEYPSAMEAGRSLGIYPTSPAVYINHHNGYYKKRNLRFEYID